MILALSVSGLVLGLLIGSFLNVVIYRLPRGMSIVSPPSACPDCHQEIRPTDNIPVLSWLRLHGRCRNCGTRISARYPLVEAGTGLVFALTAWVVASTMLEGALAWIVFCWVVEAFGIALGAIDADLHRLPNSLTMSLLAVVLIGLPLAALLAGMPIDSWPVGRALVSGTAWTGIYALLWGATPLILGKAGMGLGDVKLAPSLGLLTGWVGWSASLIGFFAAFFVGLAIALPLLLSARVDRTAKLAHGPNMLVGAVIGIAVGPMLVNAYLSFITK